ncbi:MAG: DUF861 domain-containing protein [Verrucomicrobiales bacterium]|nr:DUF861 domain-containing protein [Verrucomicrobiales bacterium]
MRIARNDIPAAITTDGAIARMQPDFGDATPFAKLAGEYYSLKAGADFAPVLQGLEDDLCQVPHWGYMLEGELTVGYKGGEQETVVTGDLFYWPPGHTVKAEADSEVIMFSPQSEHCRVIEHIQSKLAG